jgi:hypothetical protein
MIRHAAQFNANAGAEGRSCSRPGAKGVHGREAVGLYGQEKTPPPHQLRQVRLSLGQQPTAG